MINKLSTVGLLRTKVNFPNSEQKIKCPKWCFFPFLSTGKSSYLNSKAGNVLREQWLYQWYRWGTTVAAAYSASSISTFIENRILKGEQSFGTFETTPQIIELNWAEKRVLLFYPTPYINYLRQKWFPNVCHFSRPPNADRSQPCYLHRNICFSESRFLIGVDKTFFNIVKSYIFWENINARILREVDIVKWW